MAGAGAGRAGGWAGNRASKQTWEGISRPSDRNPAAKLMQHIVCYQKGQHTITFIYIIIINIFYIYIYTYTQVEQRKRFFFSMQSGENVG